MEKECKNCTHWVEQTHDNIKAGYIGGCYKLQRSILEFRDLSVDDKGDVLMSFNFPRTAVYTMPNFGCNNWSEKVLTRPKMRRTK